MWRVERKHIRIRNSQAAKTPEFVLGINSPPKRSAQPFSVSPVAESLHAFAATDGEAESPGGAAVRLSEFIGGRSRNKSRRRRKPAASAEEFSRLEENKPSFVEQEAEFQAGKEDDQSNRVLDSVTDGLGSGKSSSGRSWDSAAEAEICGQTSDPKDLESLLITKLLQQLQEQEEAIASLPDDEVSQNKQDQDEEIVALEAIYEDGFEALNAACFTIDVSFEISETMEVSLPSSSRTSSSSSSSSSSDYSFSLEYLPPLRFAFTFPSSYPSRTPPVFVLESNWLPAEKLVHLTQRLDQIWEEQKSEVVVFPWTDFLRSQALIALGASEKLVLDSSPSPWQRDELNDLPRVVSGSTSAEKNAVALLSYNEKMQRKSFLTSLHLCVICFTEYVGKDLIELPCHHAYCRSCMQQYASVHVTDGSVNRLKCPDVKCSGSIPPFVLKELLGDEEFMKWENLLLQKTLDSMSDVVYCPRCSMACIEDTGANDAQCQKCFFTFCSLCRSSRHAGQMCLSPEERLRMIQDRGKGNMTEEQRRREENLLNELKNLELVNKDSKQCPTCGMGISKSEGCNKMTCSNCGKYFCFTCGKKISGYDHFWNGGCVLFPTPEPPQRELYEPDILRVILQQEAAVLAGQFPERVRICPTCGQRNVKMNNNNHMFCANCQNHYCGICLKLVRKAAEHFGPNKCKQHTADTR